MPYDVIFWGVVFVITGIIEAATFGLTSIWFSLAALVTMLFALTNLSFALQAVIFVVLSVVLLIATRPFVKKCLKVKPVATNYELDIGKTAKVIEEINPDTMSGRVMLEGVSWQAVSEDGTVIPSGHAVIVKSVDGSHLVVAE